jgi:hypothetical protein
MWKIATRAAAIGLSLCLATVADAAGRGGFGGGGGGAHFGGGGGAHFGGGGGGFGGGAAHFGGGMAHFGGAAPHFGGGGVPHFSGGVRRFNGNAMHFTPHGVPHNFARGNIGHTHIAAPTSHIGRSTFHAAGHGLNGHGPLAGHAITSGVAHAGPVGTHFAHAGTFGGPRTFAAHRQFAAAGAFHPFWNHGWHWHHHLGWIGPVFWPFAYGDFFYYALWPDYYTYYDPFWVYGYPDIYEGIFSPYDYSEYVEGPSAPARMKALTESMAQSCTEETDEVTGWPIDQINAAVQPDQQQAALLDDLGNAVVKASETIRANCPTTVSFTPTGRLDAMQQRLQGLVQAVDIISPPLNKFYDSLSDEQKARFNAIKPPADQHAAPEGQNASSTATPKSECDATAMAWPSEQIDRVVQPTEAQRAKLDALQAAVNQGTDLIKAACPSEIPSTPPARLAAAGKHLQAMLQAVDAIRGPLHDFYNSLSDDQKARFNTMGKQLFAQKSE